MTRYSAHHKTLETPQIEQADPRQVPNSAGGYAFELSKWNRLDRWLILGCEGNTYYATEQKLVKENAKTIAECLNEDGPATVKRIVEISDSGRAPKNDPAIFALAMAAGAKDPATRRAALGALPSVCRTGTHLFQFVEDVEGFRGWGRSLARAVGDWYAKKPADKAAYQAVKYQQRNGWSVRDVLRRSHPKAPTAAHQALFRYVVDGPEGIAETLVHPAFKERAERRYAPAELAALPQIVCAVEAAKTATRPELVRLIRENDLPHECVPTESKNDPEVWEALLQSMGATALLRNLGKMTAVGLLKPFAQATKDVASKLTTAAFLKRGRIHPIAILTALKVYAQGKGIKGSLTWSPCPQVVEALDEAFYLSFGTIEPTGKNVLVALDVSGSMTWNNIAGSPFTPREASAAMAMVTVRAETNYHVVAFTGDVQDVPITAKMSLAEVVKAIERMPAGRTDCAQPMLAALYHRWDVDAFQIYTDNETWAGTMHPHQALTKFRREMGKPRATLAVVGMTSTGFSIADKDDPYELDFVGFDSAAPQLMADFARGEV